MKGMVLGALVLGATVSLTAQSPTATDAPEVPVLASVPAPIPVGSRVGEMSSDYDDGGRRDPFASLVVAKKRPTNLPTMSASRPRRGLAGLALADVSVSGVVRSGDKMLAILAGPNNQSYVTHADDHLLDATVVRVEDDGVVFAAAADVGGPVSQVRKLLRSAGEGIR